MYVAFTVVHCMSLHTKFSWTLSDSWTNLRPANKLHTNMHIHIGHLPGKPRLVRCPFYTQWCSEIKKCGRLQYSKLVSNLCVNWLHEKQTLVWKHECKAVRNGCLADRASMRFSVIVHSTSSSSIIASFFSTFIAYTSSVPFSSAINTFNTSQYSR